VALAPPEPVVPPELPVLSVPPLPVVPPEPPLQAVASAARQAAVIQERVPRFAALLLVIPRDCPDRGVPGRKNFSGFFRLGR